MSPVTHKNIEQSIFNQNIVVAISQQMELVHGAMQIMKNIDSSNSASTLVITFSNDSVAVPFTKAPRSPIPHGDGPVIQGHQSIGSCQ